MASRGISQLALPGTFNTQTQRIVPLHESFRSARPWSLAGQATIPVRRAAVLDKAVTGRPKSQVMLDGELTSHSTDIHINPSFRSLPDSPFGASHSSLTSFILA